jgi:hypothetical protein
MSSGPDNTFDMAAINFADAASVIQCAMDLFGLDRFDEAVGILDKAIAGIPANGLLHECRALMLRRLGRHHEAIESGKIAMSLGVTNGYLQLAHSFSLLAAGDFAAGFSLLHRRTAPRVNALFSQPLWCGESSLQNRTILLHSDVGFGDAIQFARYAQLVAAAGGRPVMGVHRSLMSLFGEMKYVAAVVAADDMRAARVDCHCPLMSLPYAFKTTPDTIPQNIPYLYPPPGSVQKWRLVGSRLKRVGFAFRGTAAHMKATDKRAVDLGLLLPLLENTDFEWWCLQKDLSAEEAAKLESLSHVVVPGNKLVAFADTAAIVSQLDLVISVDTSVAHLAGALGRPVWVLSKFSPDWRWVTADGVVRWYPTARLICQKRPGDWVSAIAEVRVELARTFADSKLLKGGRMQRSPQSRESR